MVGHRVFLSKTSLCHRLRIEERVGPKRGAGGSDPRAVGRLLRAPIRVNSWVALRPDDRMKRPPFLSGDSPTCTSGRLPGVVCNRDTPIGIGRVLAIDSNAWQPADKPGLDLGS